VRVLEVIQKSGEFLTNKGVDSPRLQAELLLAHVLQLPRMKLYLNFERELSDNELTSVRELVRRRGQREPLQHIIGSTSFCGLEIAVSRGVLIPRPETELLAELGWEFLKKHAKSETTALDFGTGSGCIAIALAVKCPAAKVVALDASEEALVVAEKNAERNGVRSRVDFLQSDGFAMLSSENKFDLIISNPPYIPRAEIETLEPEVRDFDPHAALDGGADGLDYYRRLAVEAPAFLRPNGRIMLEFGDGQAGDIKGIFEASRWAAEGVVEDYTQRPRIFVAKRD